MKVIANNLQQPKTNEDAYHILFFDDWKPNWKEMSTSGLQQILFYNEVAPSQPTAMMDAYLWRNKSDLVDIQAFY